jgi:hypothetical protein
LTEFRLSIGGILTTVVSGDPGLTLTVPDAVSRFVVEGGTCDVHVEARWRDDQPFERGRLLFDSGGLWQLHETDGQFVWTFRSPKFGRAPYKAAVFQSDFSKGAVYLHRPYFDGSAPIYPLEYPLDELIITNWLALGRGVEIHGCAVCDANGAGYLFAGHSGAGKSTIARLWQAQPGVTVLSDDRVIVRKIDNQIWMYGTPWHGDEPLASPARAPLTRGFFLRHATSNQLVGTPRTETVAGLLTRSFPPFSSASGLEFTLAVLTEIAQHAPFWELGFVPDDGVPDFLRAIRQ